ncbi:MAG: hypothetical protein KTR16_11700 [Acidiferrobacterales bacterium]|nr:hypothetical protein [Acidiferrobacterales bacterium]
MPIGEIKYEIKFKPWFKYAAYAGWLLVPFGDYVHSKYLDLVFKFGSTRELIVNKGK